MVNPPRPNGSRLATIATVAAGLAELLTDERMALTCELFLASQPVREWFAARAG